MSKHDSRHYVCRCGEFVTVTLKATAYSVTYHGALSDRNVTIETFDPPTWAQVEAYLRQDCTYRVHPTPTPTREKE